VNDAINVQNLKLYYPFCVNMPGLPGFWQLLQITYGNSYLLPGLYTEQQILSHLNSYSNSIITIIVLLRLLYLASLICLFTDAYMFSH